MSADLVSPLHAGDRFITPWMTAAIIGHVGYEVGPLMIDVGYIDKADHQNWHLIPYDCATVHTRYPIERFLRGIPLATHLRLIDGTTIPWHEYYSCWLATLQDKVWKSHLTSGTSAVGKDWYLPTKSSHKIPRPAGD
jgi:hypothetical protein